MRAEQRQLIEEIGQLANKQKPPDQIEFERFLKCQKDKQRVSNLVESLRQGARRDDAPLILPSCALPPMF